MLRCFAAFVCLAVSAACAGAQAPPNAWPIRVVIVTTFERGADTGDIPGEFQFWVEREHLDQVLEFPGGIHPIRTNADHSVLGIVSGTTLVNAASSIMALGLDTRFDLTHAYWLINGIAGVDPEDASIGSAAWAAFVVNDISRYIDPREAPADWSTGYFAIGAHRPGEAPAAGSVMVDRTNVYTLNRKLTEWAYQFTKDVPLMDTPDVAAFRAEYKGFPNAQKPPFVLVGDSFASDTYWHGKLMTDFANQWVRMFTQGKGNFVMTNMEDSAFAEALERLDRMHRADFQRVMVLRTGSNYCMPRPGHSAVESVTAPYIGGLPALEDAYRVGSKVLHELLAHWDRYGVRVPGE